MSEEYFPGKGCKCMAHDESECTCGADWTDDEVYKLREENERLKKIVVKCAVPLETLYGEIKTNPYKELSPELQNEIVKVTAIIRQSLQEKGKCSHKTTSPRKRISDGKILKFCQDCMEYV